MNKLFKERLTRDSQPLPLLVWSLLLARPVGLRKGKRQTTIKVSIYLSLCLRFSAYEYVCLCVCVSVSVYLCLCLSLCMCLSLPVYLSISLSLCVYVCVYASVSLSVSLSLCVCRHMEARGGCWVSSIALCLTPLRQCLSLNWKFTISTGLSG